MQVVADADCIKPEPEDLCVLCLFKGELRQVHLVTESPLGAHGRHERLDVLGHRLLAGDELRAEPGRIVTFPIGERVPVRPVAREVDIGRIPKFRIAADEQLERQGIPVKPSLA